MKKEVRKEYTIMRCGRYIIEGIETGLFKTTEDAKKATPFPTIENTIAYVENDLHLNIANVSIHEIKTEITESPLVLSNGSFVYLSTVEQCNVCNKWFPYNEMYRYNHNLNEPIELLCEKHYEEIDDKYPNCLESKYIEEVK